MAFVEEEIRRWKALKKDRNNFDQLWQEIADIMFPKRADITQDTLPGEKRTDIIYDGTPMLARRGLASAIDGLLKPKTSQWFTMQVADADLNEIDAVKRWLSEAQDRMWNAIYSREARFVQRTGEVDNDLVAFGIGILFIGERSDLGGLVFKSIHPKQIVIAENADGIIDTVYYDFPLTARQANQKFGDEVGKPIKDVLNNKAADNKEFTFVQVVKPRSERDGRSKLDTDLPFASVTIDVEGNKVVEETGFHEMPFAIPRWDTASGEVYGRSPAMIALPDANTLQAMGKTMLVAGQKAVDPPLWMLDDGVIGVPRTFPGGITIVDSESARAAGGSPFDVLNTGSNIPLGREMQNDTRSQVEAAFFRNVFNLPVEGPQMTATEVIERKEQFIREIGPVFGRLESDYIGHIVERVFGIMMRAGAFPEPPEVLFDREIKFTFRSPIQQARKQIESAAAAQSMQLLAPFVQADPSILDNFNGDEIVRSSPEAFGIPIEWIRSEEEVEQLRQARAEAQQAREQMEATQQAADVANKVAPQ